MGAYGTYAQLAIGIAGLIYSIVTQEESEIPEPQELQVNNYSRNHPVPLVYGTDKVAGTCIYIGNTGAEYVEAGAGKGGFMMIAGLFIGAGPQQQPGWYYSADFCIGMCEGEAYAIDNIYLNDVSLIDVLDQFSYDFERGTNTQIVNSAISDFLTDGSAVPWRNTAYLWMSGQLGATNQIPKITAEISGLLSYKAMPITSRWKNLTPARLPTSYYETGSEDWCSYHVTGFVWTNYGMNWTYQKGDDTVYVIHHDSQYNNAAMDIITIHEDFTDDAFLILKVSNNQPTWGGNNYYFYPHNLQTKVELIKGSFPTGIARGDNWFGFIDRSAPAYDSGQQCTWDIMKICSTDPVNMYIWFGYEYCFSDTGYIRKGDYLYFFNHSQFCEYVGTWYNTTDALGNVTTGLQHAITAMTDDYGTEHFVLCPSGLSTSSSSETFQPCCTRYCLEMWHTHLLYRWRVNAYPDPCIYSVASYENPYFPNISEGGFTFPNYHRPYTAIGNNERHPKRYILCQSNNGNMTGNIEMSLWEMIGDGEHTTKILDFVVSGSYYTYGNYLQEVSIYYVGSWIYMMFNIYQSGMPADYVNKIWRYNPCTNVLESIIAPDRVFRDSHKITKGTDGNILCVSSRQDALGDSGSHALFLQWDTFPGLGPDISPIEVCYDFMTNERYGMGISASLFDGSPYVSSATSTWYNENMYCYESIKNDTALQNNEARFLYSRTFDEHMKGFDLIKDILQTCRGFLYYCDGKIKVKIEKGTETPVIYFGNEEVTLLANNHVAGDKDAIYLDDNRLNNYWAGDLVYIFYIDGYGSMPYGVGGYGGTEIQIDTEFGITTPLFTKAIVLTSTESCLTLIENMTYEVPLDTPIIIKKDNFKKDSFKYEYKPETQRINQVHLEFINRNDEYRTDILDVQDEYNINSTGEIREQSYTMKGVKRDTQARRMITYLADSLSYINWSCSFDTDIVGMLLCIGDIVGVTDEINGWYGKFFRLTEMEETEDYEHKLILMEYIPTIYNDEYIEYTQPSSYRYDNITEQPDHVINLKCIEDRRENKIWIGFSKPITNNSWWIGAHIYHYNPNTSLWEYLGISYFNTFTAAISSSITATQTTIPFSTTHYDSDKLQSSGIIWIENEMIYYRDIDDTNHQFLYCERGYKDTLAVSHSSGTCVYLRDNLYYYSYNVDSDVDKTHIFKAVSVTGFGIMADGDTAPTFSILIDGNYLLPFPVGNLVCYELE